MSHLLALLPVLTVLGALLVLQLPVWTGALIGLAVALVQFSLSGGDPVRWDAGAVLLLGAVMVVVPGLSLNGILRLRGVHVRLAAWVQAVPLPVPWKTCLIVLGVGPALESLTGFGISLLVTVPILMALSPPAVAVRQALLGMAVVPWGALGLPTEVGARLIGAPVDVLGTRTALLYVVLMPVVGGLATFLGRDGSTALRRVWPGALCGLGQALVLVAVNAAGMTPVAGVAAGGTVAVAVLLPGLVRRQVPRLPRGVVAPYAAVLVTVAVVQTLRRLDAAPDLSVPIGAARLAPLTSPGLALIVAVLLFVRTDAAAAAGRAALSSWRPVCALGGFILMAQVMTADGSFAVLAAGIGGAGTVVVSTVSPAMALASGFLTGSATSANALMMTTQASLGTGALAPSIQNAGAGIAMLASLPTASLALTVAGISGRRAERSLVAFDLRLLAVFAVLLIATSVVAAPAPS